VSPAYLRTASTAVRILRPEVIHAHSLHFHGSVVAARLRQRLSVPLVITAHVAGIDQLSGVTRVLAEAQERTIARWILARSDRVTAVSTAVKAHCVRRGAAAASVTIVRNGVDHERFTPSRESERPVPLVLYVGRLVPDKGPQVLLDAATLMARAGGHFELAYVGDGPLRSKLENEASRRGIPAIFAGNSTDVAGWMKRANVLALPSFKEGFGLVIAEAMASRRCVVASDLPSTRELVEHGLTGLLHPPGDAAALSRHLERVLSDDVLRRSLAQRGFDATSDLTWERTAAGHARVLADTIENHAHTRVHSLTG
jgi:glycosyltransferase involved in cell wall biosynthesis